MGATLCQVGAINPGGGRNGICCMGVGSGQAGLGIEPGTLSLFANPLCFKNGEQGSVFFWAQSSNSRYFRHNIATCAASTQNIVVFHEEYGETVYPCLQF